LLVCIRVVIMFKYACLCTVLWYFQSLRVWHHYSTNLTIKMHGNHVFTRLYLFIFVLKCKAPLFWVKSSSLPDRSEVLWCYFWQQVKSRDNYVAVAIYGATVLHRRQYCCKNVPPNNFWKLIVENSGLIASVLRPVPI